MAVDLKSMTPKQLEKLAADIAKELESRASKQLDAAIKAAAKAAKEHGFELSEIVGSAPKKRSGKKGSAKPKLPPRYKNPANGGQTWSGRGRQPEWYKDAIKAGKSPQSLEI
ncbi:MAG: H-NS histone family protein [Paracoccaceae bacterium]|nr:H-NS histone family protein [Paracoccaceae bacterium]